MIEVFDRVPTLPGRVKLTKEDGTEEYVTWERADEPTETGTPINKALFDSIKQDLENRSLVTHKHTAADVGALSATGTATKANTIASGAIYYGNCGSWSGEIAASGYTSTLTVTPTARSGYTFLGVVSYSSSSSYFCCYGLLTTSGKIQLYGRNINTKAITPTVDLIGLYIKN